MLESPGILITLTGPQTAESDHRESSDLDLRDCLFPSETTMIRSGQWSFFRETGIPSIIPITMPVSGGALAFEVIELRRLLLRYEVLERVRHCHVLPCSPHYHAITPISLNTT